MALTKISGHVLQQPFNLGIASATSFNVDGNTVVGGGVTFITAGSGISINSHTGSVVISASGGGGGGGEGVSVSIGDTAPSSPSAGNLWWKSDEGKLKIYYTDIDSSQWVDAFLPTKGNSGTIQIGTVTTGETGVAASVTNSGNSSSAILNFTLPKGNTGTAATITVGTVTTGSPGTAASVINSGTSSNVVLDFTIPRGADGTVTTSQAIAFAIGLG
jgi:hypothetical protein